MGKEDGNPEGYKRVARFDCGEVVSNGRTAIVLASPHRGEPEGHPDSHNCDQMGCGSSHVIWRGRVTPFPARTDEWVESTAENLVTTMTGDPDAWDQMSHDEQNATMEAVNNVYNDLASRVAPPAPEPLTVARALMLPEVLDGSRLVQYECDQHPRLPFAIRVIGDAVYVEHIVGGKRGRWRLWMPNASDYRAPCTLVDPEPTS